MQGANCCTLVPCRLTAAPGGQSAVQHLAVVQFSVLLANKKIWIFFFWCQVNMKKIYLLSFVILHFVVVCSVFIPVNRHFSFFSSDFFFSSPKHSSEDLTKNEKDASLFQIFLLLGASSHFHPSPPAPTPDSSLYRCSHKSHNAPVIITPTPVYLQPVAWRGASLSLSLCLSTSLCPPPPFSLLSFLLLVFLPSFLPSCHFVLSFLHFLS